MPLAAALWGAGALGSQLASTGGHLSMPLDDAYIFFQYARRFAAIPGSRLVHLHHNKHELTWMRAA